MNEITYNLCHTPVICFFVFITNLCAFPNVFETEKINLNEISAVSNVTFEAPVSKEYSLELVINYEPNKGTLGSINIFLGRLQLSTCLEKPDSEVASINSPKGKGISTPLEIYITSAPPLTTKEHFYISGSCGLSWWARGEVGRELAKIYLLKGKYTLSARPLSAIKIPNGTHSTLQLSPGHSK
jgi:hypothetical protein